MWWAYVRFALLADFKYLIYQYCSRVLETRAESNTGVNQPQTAVLFTHWVRYLSNWNYTGNLKKAQIL
jgi:hypothetical protein